MIISVSWEILKGFFPPSWSELPSAAPGKTVHPGTQVGNSKVATWRGLGVLWLDDEVEAVEKVGEGEESMA